MKIQYLGPLSMVRFEGGLKILRGESAEVSDAVGTELTTQRPEEFVAAKAAKPKKGDD